MICLPEKAALLSPDSEYATLALYSACPRMRDFEEVDHAAPRCAGNANRGHWRGPAPGAASF